MPFSDKKIIPGNTEHDGTDGSSVGIPPVLRKRKTSEFRSKLFLGREKPLEFRSELFLGRQKPVLNHFLEEKYPWNSFPNHFWIRKTSEFCSKLFSEEKKPLEFRSESFSEEKILQNSVRIHFRKRKNLGKTTFVSCFVKPNYFVGFRFVPSYGMDSSDILGITPNEHFIPRKNENRSESIPRIFSERNFDGNPN
jgi:hypothetical protein